VNVSEAISRLYDLQPGTTPVEEGFPHERPHKPLLLLAAFDLIEMTKDNLNILRPPMSSFLGLLKFQKNAPILTDFSRMSQSHAVFRFFHEFPQA